MYHKHRAPIDNSFSSKLIGIPCLKESLSPSSPLALYHSKTTLVNVEHKLCNNYSETRNLIMVNTRAVSVNPGRKILIRCRYFNFNSFFNFILIRPNYIINQENRIFTIVGLETF